MRLDEFEKGDQFIWARVLPRFGTYDLYDLKARTAEPTFLVGIEKKSNRAYCFSGEECEYVFKNRGEALEYLKQMKEKYKDVKVAQE